MKKGFGSIHSASGMKKYLDRKIKYEVERNKPGVRTAEVVSIDRAKKKCEVRYPGEEGTVRVPYGNAEPAEIGARVKIDGPVGERRIVDIVGRSRVHDRLDRVEIQQGVSPLWARSISDYSETFPLMWINPTTFNPEGHNGSNAHCSPIIITRDMHISMIEVKARQKPRRNIATSSVRLALHRVDTSEVSEDEDEDAGAISFNLRHVFSSGEVDGDVDTGTWRYGYTLDEPLRARAGEVYTISYASYNEDITDMVPESHPVMEYLEHPTLVQTLGRNQFTRGWYRRELIDGDVMRADIGANLTQTIWAAAFPLPAGEGYVDEVEPEREEE